VPSFLGDDDDDDGSVNDNAFTDGKSDGGAVAVGVVFRPVMNENKLLLPGTVDSDDDDEDKADDKDSKFSRSYSNNTG